MKTINASIFEEALHFAIDAHKGQLRKNGLPYICHPLAVMMFIRLFKDSKNALFLGVCSLLHDTVEDCGVTLDTIREKYGEAVATVVQELTTDDQEMRKIGKPLYLAQKMTKMSTYALALKLCDRYHNILELPGTSEHFQKRYTEETRFILEYVTANRKLTATHARIIQAINKTLGYK